MKHPPRLEMNTSGGCPTYAPAVATLLLQRSGIPADKAAALVQELAGTHGSRIPERALRSLAPAAPTSAVPTRSARSLAAIPRGCATIGDWAEGARLSQWELRRLLEALRSPQDPEPYSEQDIISVRDFNAALRKIKGRA